MNKVLNIGFRAPITEAQKLSETTNVVGLRNGGNSLVNLDNGAWSLLPGESLFLGSQTDDNNVFLNEIQVAFQAIPAETAPQDDKLQILIIKNSNC